MVLTATAVTVAALVLGACSAKKSPDASGSSQSSTTSSSGTIQTPTSSSSAPAPEAAVFSLSASAGAKDVSPVAPVTVGIAHGELSEVTLKNTDGTAVKGSLSGDKTSWTSGEPLGYGKTYRLTATGTDTAGSPVSKTSSFTTVVPDNQTMAYITTAAGQAFVAGQKQGVGQVVRIHFDEQIADKKAAQSAVTVTTTPKQAGAFSWLDDQNVYWRTKGYLQPGTKVSIKTSIYGKNFGGASASLYGQADSAASFTVGDRHVSIADDNTKLIQVYQNNKLIKTIPTSMGKHTSIPGDAGLIDLRTNSGPHVVIGGETNINMNSASFGLSKGANAYKTIVPVGVKISYDGEYVHWADWSIWAQGNTDTSHGCLNVSPDNSWWFYHWSQPGDIVDVKNTGRTLQEWNSGYWNVSWASWLAGSAK
ncbi:Ig-like domain-containing protein [Jatrophihabitans telluris]|uniref:Ig-like domain-containing protein n=1 Tax=Jatrophihabitans telluris TaxID=2038343 RepID=A0ABY4QW70_9ACTN|nr:Ig-like domain-containing protein [Jatrophihabitans telluris]UQX87291.1 Ig-like domain-containing protein [Jatrophihabitans telluris]